MSGTRLALALLVFDNILYHMLYGGGVDWGSFIGPAVVAAGVSGIVSVVGLIVSTRAARAIHTEKLAFDRDQAAQKLAFDDRLAERKVNADIALAEKKIALDASLADRKRRQDLAEEVLSSFYQMVDTIGRSALPRATPMRERIAQNCPAKDQTSRRRETPITQSSNALKLAERK
jgi:hypothetical protein